MPRRRLTLATIAVVIAVTTRARTGPRALLSTRLRTGPGQHQLRSVATERRTRARWLGGSGAGQAQQFLNSFGQGAPSTAAGALGGVLNSFGLGGGGSGVAPQGSAAPQGYNGGTAQNGVGGGSTNDYGGQRVSKISAHDPCSLLTAGDISAVLGSPVTWSSAGAGGPTADTVCSYSTDDHTSITVSVNGGRADFDNNTRQMNSMASQYHMQPLIPVSGVGDKAFMNPPSTGGGGAGRQVYVLKGGTYFYVGVQSDKVMPPTRGRPRCWRAKWPSGSIAIRKNCAASSWGRCGRASSFVPAIIHPERHRKIADWLADDAVSIEPVSSIKFPDQQGKYREFLRFPRRFERLRYEMPWNRLGFFGKFPTHRNRELSSPNRESLLRIREISARNSETILVVAVALISSRPSRIGTAGTRR